MSYWWVNHKQTHASEIEGGYIWSPKTESNGANSEFYNNMTRVKPGDIVFSYADAKIKAIGVVTNHYREAAKPTSFGSTGSNWASTGWIVPIEWKLLEKPFSAKSNIYRIGPLLPNGYSPINLKGNGNQKCYLASISEELAQLLFSIADDKDLNTLDDVNNVLLEVGTDFEVNQVLDANIDSTEKEQIIKARLGQGVFRQRVIKKEKRCRLTGVSELQFLVASHIKPWRDCNNIERLDGNNGLLLSPHLDRLFDKGWISFTNDGVVLVSNERVKTTLVAWGIVESINAGAFDPLQSAYLEYHRHTIFKQPKAG